MDPILTSAPGRRPRITRDVPGPDDTIPLAQVAQASAIASSPTFTAGEVVASRYQVVRLIGAGGMGAVYEVIDHELGVTVALKTLLPELAPNERLLELFKREVQMARR